MDKNTFYPPCSGLSVEAHVKQNKPLDFIKN